MNILSGSSRLTILALTIVVITFISWFLWFTPSSFTQLILRIGLHTFQVEVADNEETRTRGMMFRMGQRHGEGMLFVLPEAQRLCMWMKYTFIPLSVAFIRDNGVIVNMVDMQPMSLHKHCSPEPVKFALEMPKLWFKTKVVTVGDRVTGLPRT